MLSKFKGSKIVGRLWFVVLVLVLKTENYPEIKMLIPVFSSSRKCFSGENYGKL